MANRKGKRRNFVDPSTARAEEFFALDVGSSSAKNDALAADVMSDELDLVRKVRAAVGDNPKAHGNLYEQIEVAKFNRNAVLAGSRLRAETTAMPSRPLIKPTPHAAGDIRILSNSRVVREVQAKCYQDPNGTIRGLAKPKYSGMQRLVPNDKVDGVANNLKQRMTPTGFPRRSNVGVTQLQDVRKNLSGELTHGKVRSGGTSSGEAKEFVDDTESSILGYKVEGAVGEATKASIVAALAAATIAGAVHLVRHAVSEQATNEITRETVAIAGKQAIKSGLKGGAVTATGAIVRNGAREALKQGAHSGLRSLARANVAGVVAAGIVNSGITVWNFAQGKCTAEEAVEEIGQNGVASISGLYFGGATGACFAPLLAGAPTIVLFLPAAIGSAAGYIVASYAYKACLSILKNARLAEDEACRIEAVCAEAICQMRAEQAEFERVLDQCLATQLLTFKKCFAKIDAGIDDDNSEGAIEGIAELLHEFGDKLLFQSFEEFDGFMQNPNATLVF